MSSTTRTWSDLERLLSPVAPTATADQFAGAGISDGGGGVLDALLERALREFEEGDSEEVAAEDTR